MRRGAICVRTQRAYTQGALSGATQLGVTSGIGIGTTGVKACNGRALGWLKKFLRSCCMASNRASRPALLPRRLCMVAGLNNSTTAFAISSQRAASRRIDSERIWSIEARRAASFVASPESSSEARTAWAGPRLGSSLSCATCAKCSAVVSKSMICDKIRAALYALLMSLASSSSV
eukprot:7364397-Prymnesium_polylepis.1